MGGGSVDEILVTASFPVLAVSLAPACDSLVTHKVLWTLLLLFFSSLWLCWLVGFGSWARRPVAAASLVDFLSRFVLCISLVRLCGVFFPFGF